MTTPALKACPNPRERPGARFPEETEVLAFLRANRETHRKWAEYFEAYPDKEAEYVATGEWDGAAEQRRLEAGYTRAIDLLQRLCGNTREALSAVPQEDQVERLREIAEYLTDQRDEPWPSGTESDRLHYWRDKAIEAAKRLSVLAMQSVAK